jgi:multidrug efflux pump subunit AcrB
VHVVDNIGLPYSGINLAYSTSAPVGPGDADIFVNLPKGHKPTADYVRTLRAKLAATDPSATFAFLPADMIGQILNFGLPSPIDIQVVGFNVPGNREFANQLLQKLRGVPGAVDLHIQQSGDSPRKTIETQKAIKLERENKVATKQLIPLQIHLDAVDKLCQVFKFWIRAFPKSHSLDMCDARSGGVA